jgi:hypothetical protein
MIQHAAGGSQRVEARSGERQASVTDHPVNGGYIGGSGGETGAKPHDGGGTEFYLAAWLGGEAATAGKRAGRTKPGERGVHALLVHRKGGVMAIVNQPFEFDPDPSGRAGLEADPVDVFFGGTFRQGLAAVELRHLS